MDGRVMDRQIDGWMDGRVWIDRWMDGRVMDRQIDGWTDG